MGGGRIKGMKSPDAHRLYALCKDLLFFNKKRVRAQKHERYKQIRDFIKKIRRIELTRVRHKRPYINTEESKVNIIKKI